MLSQLTQIFFAVALAASSSADTKNAGEVFNEDGAPLLLAQVGPGPAGALEIGGAPIQGRLTAASAVRSNGALVDRYTLDIEQPQAVRLYLRSPDFDTWLSIRGPYNFYEQNDDTAGMGTNSSIDTWLRQPGRYIVEVSSYASGASGQYTLNLQAGAPRSTSEAPLPRLERGSQVSGALARGDTQLRSGEFVQMWIYDARAGEQVSFTLESNEFDPYLMVRGTDGLSVDNDDRAPGDLTAQIDVTIQQAGPIQVLVTSYAPGESGAFRLRASASSTGGVVTSSQRLLTLGTPVQGNLGAGDLQRSEGPFMHRWRYEGHAGELISVEMSSNDFDTFLLLETPDGQILTNDDIQPGNTNSRLRYRLESNGTYSVIASAYATGAGGAYSLVVEGERTGTPPTEVQVAAQVGSVQVGQSVAGRLQRGNETLSSGEFFETHTIRGQSGQAVTIRMVSSEVDSYLMLRGPNGFSLDNDDGPSDDGRNSRIEVTFPANGEYRILATTYAPGESGRYTLIVEEGTTVTRGARGRVFAILAGISDYGGHGDLPYCAEDATKLGDTLRLAGADEAIVLTDSQVTRAGLARAFQQMSRRVGPDDVFLFFYSGHGGYTNNPAEMDGRDETLIVRGGEVTDDEVAAWFDTIRARLAIIALDSCFAGGFARDVISAPNRMGIFSSEEDVTSNVADRFQAGGYLSLFLRLALEGAADTDGDGIITAGELTQFLRQQWQEHQLSSIVSETADSAFSHQNLVIDRGAVRVTDVVLYR